MAFNSHTYHANKYRAQSQAELADARRYKAEGRDVDIIRASARLAVIYARLARITAKLRRMQREGSGK